LRGGELKSFTWDHVQQQDKIMLQSHGNLIWDFKVQDALYEIARQRSKDFLQAATDALY